jgi:hypothetical protein
MSEHIFEKEKDTLNRELTAKLVKDYFSLSKKSQELFENKLFNPLDEMDEKYKSIIGNDLRARFPLKENLMEETDQSWIIFKNRFKSFVEENNVKYSDFLENKIEKNKNEYKIFKFVKEYYLQNAANLKKFYDDYLHQEFTDFNIIKNSTFSYCIDKTLEYVSMTKLPREINKAEIVISLNFTDWLLCSTENGWSSCLSLESGNCEAFWAGLPGTIVDKNRAMLYMTTGEKKNYRGIEVDKVFLRTWLLLDNHDELKTIRYYPRQLISEKIISKASGFDLYQVSPNYHSKHKFPIIFFNNEKSSYIYQDGTHLKREEDFVSIHGSRGGFGYFQGKGSELINEPIFRVEGGLSAIVCSKSTLSQYEICDDYSCEMCGEGMSEEDVFHVEGSYLCQHCYEEHYISCYNCGGTVHRDYVFYDDYNGYCESCFCDIYYICDDCGKTVEHEEATEIDGSHFCKKCASKRS